jgi:predicted nucleic acid-binding protein
MTYALDSNIVSYLLKDNDNVYSRYFDALSRGDHCVIPLVVYYEIRRGLKAAGATVKMRSFENICYALGVDELTVADMNVAADIYADRKRKGRPIEDADLLIAAQAVARGHTLVTNNAKHFGGIDGLLLANWAE